MTNVLVQTDVTTDELCDYVPTADNEKKKHKRYNTMLLVLFDL